MSLKFFKWGSRLFLLLLFFLSACDQAREAERLIASAEKSEKKGQLSIRAHLLNAAGRGLTVYGHLDYYGIQV